MDTVEFDYFTCEQFIPSPIVNGVKGPAGPAVTRQGHSITHVNGPDALIQRCRYRSH